MTPAFKNYILDLIKTADSDYGLTAGPGVIHKDYNRIYVDGKTDEEYWGEVVENRLLKVTPLYEEAWDPDTQTLSVDTDFSKYLIYPEASNGFPAVWSSGNHAEKNREAFEKANKWILLTKKPEGKNFLQQLKIKIILEEYEKAPPGEIQKTVCKKLDESLGKLSHLDPVLENWHELSYVGALKNKSETVKSWISMVHSRAIKTS